MLKLNEELKRHGVFYPDDPASYPCSLVGGRIGTGGWSLLGARFGHTRDNVVSMEVVLPTGEIVEIGDGGGRKLRKSSTAFNLKQLFTGPPGHARHLHRGHARARAPAGGGVRGVLRLRRLHEGVGDHGRAHEVGPRDARGGRPLRRVEGRLPAARRRGLHPAAGLGQGRRGRRHVRQPRGGGAGVEDRDEARPQPRRQVPRGRDLLRRLGLAARPLRHAAARPLQGGPGGDDVLALRGRRAQLLRPPAGARGVARDRLALPRAVRHLRRLGDVRLHQRPLQAVGRLPGRDRRRHLGAASRRRELGRVGRLQARDLRGDAQVRRLDHGVPRGHARGRRGARAGRDGQRMAGREGDQARAGPQQRHEPGQAVARRGLRGGAP